MTDTTIDTVAEQEAERIRRRGVRQHTELLLLGQHDLARAVVRAAFLEQLAALDLPTDGWADA
jgi:hypothetical protein